MASTKLFQDTIKLPEEICVQAALQDGDEFEISIVSKNILQLERVERGSVFAPKSLEDFLKAGFSLGVKGTITREEIYDDLA